jgi:integrase
MTMELSDEKPKKIAKLELTDLFLRAMKAPAEGRVEFYDTKRKGLRIRHYPSGKMTWLYQKQIKGGPRRALTLGTYPTMSLASARDLALSIEAEAQTGVDRVEVKAEAFRKAEAEALAARTVGEILELYVVNHIRRNLKEGNSKTEREVQLRTHLEALLTKRIDSIKRVDLQRIVDKKAAEGKVTMANRLRAAFTAFFGWALKCNHIEVNPSDGLQSAGKEVPRDRTPSLKEVQEIWAASFKMGDLWGPFFRLCILTGQRSRSDILAMKWSWIDIEGSRFEVPIPKNSKAHIVHLCEDAKAELTAIKLRQVDRPSDFVFTTTGVTAASGSANAKEKLDLLIAAARTDQKVPPMEKWVIHDLRRAQATALAEAGFDETVVDRIQNHVASGSRASAVSGVYNKAQRLPERARALDAWADMVTGRSGNVVHIADRRAV